MVAKIFVWENLRFYFFSTQSLSNETLVVIENVKIRKPRKQQKAGKLKSKNVATMNQKIGGTLNARRSYIANLRFSFYFRFKTFQCGWIQILKMKMLF